MSGKKYGIPLTIATGLAAAVAYHVDALLGLAGVAVGVVIGLGLSCVSHFFTRRAGACDAADVQRAISCVYLSVGASFAIVIVSTLVIHFVWSEILPSAILTTMAFYLVYRFTAVLEAWPAGRASTGSVSTGSVSIGRASTGSASTGGVAAGSQEAPKPV